MKIHTLHSLQFKSLKIVTIENEPWFSAQIQCDSQENLTKLKNHHNNSAQQN